MSIFQYFIQISVTHREDIKLSIRFYDEVIMPLLCIYDVSKLPLFKEMKSIALDKEYLKRLFINEHHIIPDDSFQDISKKLQIDIDVILITIVGFMKSNDLIEQDQKELESHSSAFKMILMILEDREVEFVNYFDEGMMQLEEKLRLKYCIEKELTFLGEKFKYVMLISAIVNNRRQIIDKIFEDGNFISFPIVFPKNMKIYSGSHYAVSKFLEAGNGNILRDNTIPKDWMNPNIFEHFLNTRIKKTYDEDRIQIDTSFFIPSFENKIEVDKNNSKEKCMIVHEDTTALEHVQSSHHLKKFLSHPTIALYIELKWSQCIGVFLLNFWIFIFFMIWFTIYIIDVVAVAHENIESSWCVTCSNLHVKPYLRASVPCMAIYMILREIFQWFVINSGRTKMHLRDASNIAETLLILSITVTYILDLLSYKEFFVYIVCFNIVLMVTILMSMIPYNFMFLQMHLFLQVAKTFSKIFLSFSVFMLSYVIIFGIIFDLSDKKKHENESQDEGETFRKNFDSFVKTGLKVLLMLSGEYQIEPFDLDDTHRVLLFLTFVIGTYIMYNLIVGQTIDEVKKLKEESLSIVVKTQLKKIVLTNRVIRKLSSKSVIIDFFLRKIYHFKNIDKIIVNLKTKEIQKLTNDNFVLSESYPSPEIETVKLFSTIGQIEETNVNKIMEILQKRHDSEISL